MSKLEPKFKLGDRVEFTEILTKHRVYANPMVTKVVQKTNKLNTPKTGIIVGFRSFPIGEIQGEYGNTEFVRNKPGCNIVKAYLICDNIYRNPYRVPVSNPVKAQDIKIGTENGIISPYQDTLIEVTSTRNYKAYGYILRNELVGFSPDEMTEPLNMKVCYSLDGLYLGSNKTANILCRKLGIRQFEKTGDDHTIVSIGFQPKEQKWYGWSHRAYCGFGIGSKVKPGDCAYSPYNKEDFQSELFKWYDIDVERECGTGQTCVTKLISCSHDVLHKEKFTEYASVAGSDELVDSGTSYGPEELGFEMVTETIFSDSSRTPLKNIRCDAYPKVWGKGSWTAKTLEDAKEMAIAFADDVS